MGTGKSTAGAKIAQKLQMDFIDIDKYIEENEGITINEIFKLRGEKYFRKMESMAVKKISNSKKTVIATGGGIVLNKDNINLLRNNGIIINLKADIEKVMENLSNDKSRPLLKDGNLKHKIEDLLEQRQEFYKDNDYEINTSLMTIDEIVKRVIQIYLKKEA